MGVLLRALWASLDRRAWGQSDDQCFENKEAEDAYSLAALALDLAAKAAGAMTIAMKTMAIKRSYILFFSGSAPITGVGLY